MIRAVASSPEACPCSAAGAASISTRVLGERKMPCPIPVRTSRHTISCMELFASSPARRTSAHAVIASPSGARQREPHRSAALPKKGAVTAIARGSGVRGAPDQVREPAEGQQQGGNDHEISDDDPLDGAAERNAKRAGNRGQADVDDRGVERRHEYPHANEQDYWPLERGGRRGKRHGRHAASPACA